MSSLMLVSTEEGSPRVDDSLASADRDGTVLRLGMICSLGGIGLLEVAVGLFRGRWRWRDIQCFVRGRDVLGS